MRLIATVRSNPSAPIVVAHHVDHVDDAGVPHPGKDASLVRHQPRAALGDLRQEPLDRDGPLETHFADLPAAEHLGLAAFAESLAD